MDSTRFDILRKNISDALLDPIFLHRFNIEEGKMHRFLYGDHFTEELHEMITRRDYHSLSLQSAMEPILAQLFENDRPEHFLQYIHDYVLHLNFPAAKDFTPNKEWEAASQVYLKAFHIMSTFQKTADDGTWQSQYALEYLPEHDITNLENDWEYRRFMEAFSREYTYELMKLNQEVVGYSTLDHVCGVHYIAMKIARQLKRLKLPVDLGRVSGAAAGHDIGKYGCRPDEMRRVAYYHYYYTGEWFRKHDIVYIRNIAINHSTWDLELENLPLEALILIYADFRVKSNENRKMTIYGLDASFQVILDKLDNVDEAKEMRYKRVYAKLKDFEEYMIHLGVDVDPNSDQEIPDGYTPHFDHYSLLQGQDIVNSAKNASIAHNIRLMHHLRDESSLNKMLESARDLNNLSGLRGYIEILEEYHTYLTQKQKLIVIKYLYERLIMPEEDIRKQCASLLGTVIGTYDEELRKELPKDANYVLPEVMAVGLFEKYVNEFMYPDQKIFGKHRDWISYATASMISAYFKAQKNEKKRRESLEFVLGFFENTASHGDADFYLLSMIKGLPLGQCTTDQRMVVLQFVYNLIQNQDINLRLAAYESLIALLPILKDKVSERYHLDEELLLGMEHSEYPAENYARLKMVESFDLGSETWEQYADYCREDLVKLSDLFLSNLKSATHFIPKKFQVELLLRHTIYNQYDNAFYTAMHFCNLLKVSALETVRNTAGEGLLQLVPNLSFEQRNDIVIELLRALEMESFQFTRYIPKYLGQLLLYLQPVEFDEILDSFEEKVKKANPQIITLMLQTVGEALSSYSKYKEMCQGDDSGYKQRMIKMLGILFNGFVNYNPKVNQTAFQVIGKSIYASTSLQLEEKRDIFRMTAKKILSLMADTDEKIELVFFNNASGLKHIYRFISEYTFQNERLLMDPHPKVAFFPGAFDPFSLSHKQIARNIRDMGFEVYLAVDEFSWSKRTQPNLIRRDIIKMSVADEIDIYTYPRYLPTNIAKPQDLKVLRDRFENAEVYVVVGADVIVNASAYKKRDGDNNIGTFKHVVFERPTSQREDNEEFQQKFEVAFKSLPEGSIRLQLERQYESISSTQIRNYIDENRDISELVDPLAQRYIYDKGLYQREPMFKEVLTTKSLTLEIVDSPTPTLLEELATVVKYDFTDTYMRFKEYSTRKSVRLLILRSIDDNRRIIGFAAFHWLRTIDIYLEFEDEYLSDYIRDHSVGRLVVIDGVYRNAKESMHNVEQRLLTETLAFCLAKDYSYAIYKDMLVDTPDTRLVNALKQSGFQNVLGRTSGESAYVVNMSSPVTFIQDIKSVLKAPFRNSEVVIAAIERSRRRMQKAMTKLYPGELVITFDRTMIYEHLIKKICDENNMPTTPLEPRTLGDKMCVPFGAIFSRWRLPNTVTKSLHTEKFFSPDLKRHKVKAAPYYLTLRNQVKTIKSFERDVILVDDLLNKGYRIKELEPLFKEHDVRIHKFFVGILSGRGKALMEQKNIDVDSAYFIPRLKVWFTESKLYPFIGGDILWRGTIPERNLFPSINLIVPYTYPSYIRDASQKAIYKMSEIAIINAIEILQALEEEYQSIHERMLTLAHLGEVIMSPRIPDKGYNIEYDMNHKGSDYLKNELEHLRRLRSTFHS